MKQIIFAILMMVSFTLSANNSDPNNGDLKTINTEESTVVWTGKKVTGQHTGTSKQSPQQVIRKPEFFDIPLAYHLLNSQH